jgi:signal transduction histidine kinase
VRIRVIDTGQGIDAVHLPRIFDRYYTTRGRTDRSHLGLGLAIVKRIMDLHAQDVTILSQAGSGTTVEITLRRQAGTASPLAKSA